MKLLDVKAVLDREKHIQRADPECQVLKVSDDEVTRYAILSHRWSGDSEVTYEEMTALMKMERRNRDEVRQRSGYRKIIESCKQAKKDGYEWLWIDTCCIDKRSSSELSEAINSMYRWYQNAQVCYAYLNDVEELSHGWPEWFVRGWTLQELIAPKQVEFFNKHWKPIGTKQCLALTLEDITKIPREVLRDGMGAKCLCVAQIMSWAADRKTTRVEDRAYSLIGLFGVNMPMLYGEGTKAFRRLQLEIVRESSDHSIFAWHSSGSRSGSALAEDPSDFRFCGHVRKVEPGDFVDKVIEEYIDGPQRFPGWSKWACRRKLAAVRDAGTGLFQKFRTFTVSNVGIQVCLPVIPLPDSQPPCFRAILACSNHDSSLITINLVSSGFSYDRTVTTDAPARTYPEFWSFYLTHHLKTPM
ncbi:heterokaryon incompatibility protein-domain-containing protein [Pisolithus tinctorius]|nr:heterokaryon incompatibility protein-domain-containing protein [Pisolithus tinctorius]